jgi:oxygen-independent coproporphyrinogen-3 oxidase
MSCYCLSFEAGTLLQRRLERGELAEPGPDEQWDLLDLAAGVLARAGFERYEVSSWCRPGRESRHNQAYWACRPVYGAGAGAHSYAAGGSRAWRWWNVAGPREYLAALPLPVLDGEELSPAQAVSERVMMALRTSEGVEVPARLRPALAQLEAAGLLERRGDRYRPTVRGLDLNNQVALAVL